MNRTGNDHTPPETPSPTVKDRGFQFTHLGFSEGQRFAGDTLNELGIEEKEMIEIYQELICMGVSFNCSDNFPLLLNCVFAFKNSLFVMWYSKWNSTLALYTSGHLNFSAECSFPAVFTELLFGGQTTVFSTLPTPLKNHKCAQRGSLLKIVCFQLRGDQEDPLECVHSDLLLGPGVLVQLLNSLA